MRHFDIIKWLWVAGIIYTFLQGYTFYMQRQGEIAVGCSFLCAFCIFQFIRRLHTLYYLHMKMKNIDKLNAEHLNVISLSSSGISVIMLHSQVIATTMEQILFFANGEKRLLFRQNAMSEMWELRLFRKLLVLLLITKLIGQWLLQIATLRKVPEISPKEMK